MLDAVTLDERIERSREALADLLAPAGTRPDDHTDDKAEYRLPWTKKLGSFNSLPVWEQADR